MNTIDAIEILGLHDGSSSHEIEIAYRKLYNEFQIRITNAPTASQRIKFQEKLTELDAAYKLLLGASSENIQSELPSLQPTESIKTNQPIAESSLNINRDRAFVVLGIEKTSSLTELKEAYSLRKQEYEQAIDGAFNAEIKSAYIQALNETHAAYNILLKELSSTSSNVSHEGSSVQVKQPKKKKILLLFGSLGVIGVLILVYLFVFSGREENNVPEQLEDNAFVIYSVVNPEVGEQVTISIIGSEKFSCDSSSIIKVDITNMDPNKIRLSANGATLSRAGSNYSIKPSCNDSAGSSLTVSVMIDDFNVIDVAEIPLPMGETTDMNDASKNNKPKLDKLSPSISEKSIEPPVETNSKPITSTNYKKMSVEGKFSLMVCDDLLKTSGLNKRSCFEVKNSAKSEYLVIIDFEQDLITELKQEDGKGHLSNADYYVSIENPTIYENLGRSNYSELLTTRTGDGEFVKVYYVTGPYKDKGFNVSYYTVVITNDKYLYNFVAWAADPDPEQFKERVFHMINSFKSK